MKKKLLCIAGLLICLAVSAAGTMAYFTAEETAHNVITTGEIDIALHEWADEDKTIPFADVKDVMPGMAVTKIAEVENIGKNAAWVRVKVTKEIILAETGGRTMEPDLSLITIAFNTTDWSEEQKDGYRYYKKEVKPGEKTAPIFTSVVFDSGMGNIYQNANANVKVQAYAAQAANNGTNVFAAKGWPEP